MVAPKKKVASGEEAFDTGLTQTPKKVQVAGKDSVEKDTLHTLQHAAVQILCSQPDGPLGPHTMVSTSFGSLVGQRKAQGSCLGN